MLGRLKAMLGYGAPASPASNSAQIHADRGALDLEGAPQDIARALVREPGLVAHAASALPRQKTLGVLNALRGQGALRVGLARAALLSASYVPPNFASKVAQTLSPAERGLVLDGVRGETLQRLQSAGFEPASGRARLKAGDLQRLKANKAALPPNLEAWAHKNSFEARADAVRQGLAGYAADERSDLRRALVELSPADRQAVRKALVLTPPHPQLAKLRGDSALVGPATVDGLLHLLSGEAFGARPPASQALQDLAERVVSVAGHGLDAATQARLTQTILRSDALVRLVEMNGAAGLAIIEHLGADFAERVENDWSAKHVITALSRANPEHLQEIATESKRRGADAVISDLRALDNASFGAAFDVPALVGDVGFARAAQVANRVDADKHGQRAYAHLHGSDGLARLLRTKRGDALSAALAEAGGTIIEFGAGGAPIFGQAERPPLDPPRAPEVARAEARIAATAGVDPEALRRGALDSKEQGEVSRAMKAFVAASRPDLASELDKELLGRRFVARRYYDELYAKGAANPEHRYSVETFESWAKGAQFVAEAAHDSKGRGLEPGEFTDTMRKAHALAAAGMIAVRESHLESKDLGRLRSDAEQHVQLGDLMHEMDAQTAARLADNPYLSPDQVVMKDGDTVRRSVIFARGPDVPKMVEALDAWVRENEGNLPPEKIAAEVHHRLVSIHPFMDGNGRTSKLMADFVLQRAGIEPPIWRKGQVMKNVDSWPEAVKEGVEFELQTVQRYFRVAASPEISLERPRPEPAP